MSTDANDLEKSPLWKKAKALTQSVEAVIVTLPHSEAWSIAQPLHQTTIVLTSDIANAIGRGDKEALFDYRYGRGHLLTVKSLLLIAQEYKYVEAIDSVLLEIETIRRALDKKIAELEEQAESEADK